MKKSKYLFLLTIPLLSFCYDQYFNANDNIYYALDNTSDIIEGELDVSTNNKPSFTFNKNTGVLTITGGDLISFSVPGVNNSDIKEIHLEGDINLLDGSFLFGEKPKTNDLTANSILKPMTNYKYPNLVKIQGLGNLNTERCDKFQYMFSGLPNLEEFDIEDLKITTKTNGDPYSGYDSLAFDGMFRDLYKLKSISLTNFDIEVFKSTYLFTNCYSLTEIDFGGIKGLLIEGPQYIYANCYSLNEIPVDITYVAKNYIEVGSSGSISSIDASLLLKNLVSIESIDLSSFNIEKEKDDDNIISSIVLEDNFSGLKSAILGDSGLKLNGKNLLLNNFNTLVLKPGAKINGDFFNKVSTPVGYDSPFTGNWVLEGDNSMVKSKSELSQYINDTGKEQVWTRQLKDSSTALTNLTVPIIASADPVTSSSAKVYIPNDSSKTFPSDVLKGGSFGNGVSSFYINWVSDFSFGDVTQDDEVLSAKVKPSELLFTDQLAPFVQVTDNRGVEGGWELTAKFNPFESSSGNIARGVSLAFPDGKFIKHGSQNKNDLPKRSIPQEIQADGNLISVLKSDSKKGYGTWSYSFTDKDNGLYNESKAVSIKIPNSMRLQANEEYVSTIEWMLSANP